MYRNRSTLGDLHTNVGPVSKDHDFGELQMQRFFQVDDRDVIYVRKDRLQPSGSAI